MESDQLDPQKPAHSIVQISHFESFCNKSIFQCENLEECCFVSILSFCALLIFLILFAFLPMPIGYHVYLFLWPGSQVSMFSILTWGLGIATMFLFGTCSGAFCVCVCCLCVT